ncbi:MAG: FAD-binding protein, partial [Nitrospirae bacterium]|nr:FAD-binding protein [Nitrospirota bacterium]
GVRTDIDGRTNIKGLFAAGEVACTGVHGANRLASNSLLEGLVFGARAGKTAVEEWADTKDIGPELRLNIAEQGRIDNPDEVRSTIRRVMWEKAGIIRSADSLNEALEVFKSLRHVTEHTYLSRYENEIKNILQTAELIVKSALERKTSIGAHYRSD